MKNVLIMIVATVALVSCKKIATVEVDEAGIWNEFAEDMFVDSASVFFEIDESERPIHRAKDGLTYNYAFDDNLEQWLVSDSTTMDSDMKKLIDARVLNYVESEDKKVRIYSWATLPETERYAIWTNVVQTKCDGRFSGHVESVFCMVHDCGEQSSEGEPVTQIITINGDDGCEIYLVEMRQDGIDYSVEYCLHSFEIKDGRLVPVGLMDKCVVLDCTNAQSSDFLQKIGADCVYRYDKQTKQLIAPESIDGVFTGKYVKYEFDGKEFVEKGNV